MSKYCPQCGEPLDQDTQTLVYYCRGCKDAFIEQMEKIP